MGYDRGDSFPFDFKPNGLPFGSNNRKENCHHDHIPFDVKGNGNIVFSLQLHSFDAVNDEVFLWQVANTFITSCRWKLQLVIKVLTSC